VKTLHKTQASNEVSRDEKQLTLTAFDPLKGRAKVLRTIQKSPADFFGGTLSPDGTTFAISKAWEAEIHIRLLSLSGGSDREIMLRGWPNASGLDWAPDGRALYVGSGSPQGETLLYADLKGNAKVLWQVVSQFALVQIISATTSQTVNEAVVSTTPDTAFRWDATDQQWIFNIGTKSLAAGRTYVYNISLNDGTAIGFQFGLR
jgi:hypothetical protein